MTNTSTPAQPPIDTRKVVTVAVLAVMVAQLPINLVSVSLTTIAADTGATTSGLQWVQSIYILAMSAAVLSAGVIAENIGRRKVMIIALWLMVLGALLGGLASLAGDLAMPVLWTGQAFSGLGGGALLPTTLGAIAMAVPDPRKRGPYMALWGAGTTGGLAVGAIVAGLILKIGSWGWIFLPSFLVAITVALITQAALPESPTSKPGMDIQGQIFATLAIIGLIFGVIQGGAQGWFSTPALLGYALGLIALALFIYRELNTYAPLMDLRVFRNPGFAAACFAAMMALFSVVGVGFMLALFLGSAKQLDPLGIATYIVFLPGTAFVVAPLAGKALAKLPSYAALLIGLLLAAVGTFLIAHTDETTAYLNVVWRLMIFGVSIAIMLASVATVAINSVPLKQAGMAGATNTVIRQIGGALGPAVIGSIYATRMAGGATPAESFTSALTVTTVLLVIAAVLVLIAEISTRRRS
ncbi:Multidrug resistance protein stp [Corynebacterium occultum]|uniref:Multidrug resistance protein stp n=1 Tax=Corynebacterium occultum TaxID=2675219 RepID=A0A6B8VWZ0_9CORY|nr:MFS transporter [Corynebacterium occultum]QGU08663.1 Multidrug resistance protein stp [Corynebacterium occultum]